MRPAPALSLAGTAHNSSRDEYGSLLGGLIR
jgi:hypothetical protein